MNYGVINLYKPIGPTSRDCVNKLVKRLKPSKVAHAGTLDPLAHGVLLILVGPAVRLMDEIHELDKEYMAVFALGKRSPSGDLETPCESVPLPEKVDGEVVRQTLTQFVGCIEQVPPPYSAVRVNGQRAHRFVRRGGEPQMPSRNVTIYDLELLECKLPLIRLRVRCSTGTYIRTLGSDLAKSIGTDAVMTELIRQRVGPFHMESAKLLDGISDQAPEQSIEPAISALSHWQEWRVDDTLMRRILDGQRLAAQDVLPTSETRLAALDSRNILRAILKQLPDGTWRCDKGIAHWDVFP